MHCALHGQAELVMLLLWDCEGDDCAAALTKALTAAGVPVVADCAELSVRNTSSRGTVFPNTFQPGRDPSMQPELGYLLLCSPVN